MEQRKLPSQNSANPYPTLLNSKDTMNNPQAFPVPAVYDKYSGSIEGKIGMTLRDYFAGQAMMGLIHRFGESLTIKDGEGLSATSYFYADSMLKERTKQTN